LEIGAIQNPTSAPDWRDVTSGTPNYTGDIGGEPASDVVDWASDPAAKINLEPTLILAARVRLAETLDLELMKMSFQSISWSQFAIFDSFEDETKRESPDPVTYDARVYLGRLDNGEDDTASRSFGFTSKTYDDITTVKTSTSTGVGSGYLEDTAASWFTDQYRNYELVDSASSVFTISSCTESPRRLIVTGTPAAGAYSIRSGLPAYVVGFCSFEDSSTGETGYTKLEVSFDDGSNWQTLLNTESSIDYLGGAVAVVNSGRDYKLRLTIKNNAGGAGAIVNKVLICTDPSVWG